MKRQKNKKLKWFFGKMEQHINNKNNYRIMCNGCLTNAVEFVNEWVEERQTCVETTKCEGCKEYYTFLIRLSEDCKVLCLTKMKKNNEECVIQKQQVSKFEGMVKERIKNKLDALLDAIEEAKDKMICGTYLSKMNDLKDINDFVEHIEELDHK